MFFGATPRDPKDNTPRASPQACDAGHIAEVSAKSNNLSTNLERILTCREKAQSLHDELLAGLERTALGNDRIAVCEARQCDAEAVLRRLESIASDHVIYEEDDFKGKSRRQEVLAWIVGCLEAFQKAIAVLEANELVARRACRHYDVAHAARLTAHETGTPPPRQVPCSDTNSKADSSQASCIELHREAAALCKSTKKQIQELSGARTPVSDTWRSWINAVACATCTVRQEEMDHSSRVVEAVELFHLQALQAEKGDILCCMPVYVDLDGVRYRSAPREDGKVLLLAVKRGEMVHVKGREGDWIYNDRGYLPLKHPVDDSLLFLFDHRRTQESESGDSSDEEADKRAGLASENKKGGMRI